MYIPYGRQSIDEADILAVTEALRDELITTGPRVSAFEQKVCAFTGAKYAVAVANGTAALHAACFAAGIGAGDEVITSPITFAASANAVLYCNGTPVFADIKKDTWNIDPEDIRKKITKKTKAIIPVHFTGQPCEMEEIRSMAREHGLLLIEDGAHALGAEYKGNKVGTLSDMTTLSFHPVKHITTGEGGMVLTDNRELYEKLLLFRSHGITRNPAQMERFEGDWYYEQVGLGYNYRITDIQCALGSSQMDKLPQFLARRREIARRYTEAFSGVKGIICPVQADGCENSWHLYVIQVTERPRRDVFDLLRSQGIGVNVHYIPVYRHPYYQAHGYQNVVCENAEEYYKRAISLPIYPGLTKEEQEYVIRHVIEACQGFAEADTPFSSGE